MEQNGESNETVMMASTIVGGASCLLRNTFPPYFIILYFLGRSWRDLFVMTYEVKYSEWRDQYYDSALLLLTMSIKKRPQLQRESLCFDK